MKNRRKNGDHYWVRANTVPMVQRGRVTGYMLIHTWTTDEEIAAVESLYKALNEERCNRYIYKGLVVCRGRLGKLPVMPIRWRVCSVMAFMFVLLAITSQQMGAEQSLLLMSTLVILFGTAIFEWQIVRFIENITRQVLKVTTDERNNVSHLNYSDELGLMLWAVDQFGLMCRRLARDVSSQVSYVRSGSETLAEGSDDLNKHMQQTVENAQEMVIAMNQMTASVE